MMSVISSRMASTIADFIQLRNKLSLLKDKVTRSRFVITGWQSTFSNVKKSRGEFPEYFLTIGIEFFEVQSCPDEVKGFDPFEREYLIHEVDPKLHITILEKISVDAILKSDVLDPQLVYISSESGILLDTDGGYTKYGINLSVHFCDAEAYDQIARIPTNVETLMGEMKTKFNGEEQLPK